MNELYELVLGAEGYFENFFKNSLSEGEFYVHFPSSSSYFQLCETFLTVFGGLTIHFMNYMKIYEGGKFKRFFWRWASFSPFGMKLDEGRSSYIFINWAGRPRPYGCEVSHGI